jgi:hypothetical protein
MHAAAAETLALTALGWAAAQGEALSEFLGASGLEIEDLRARAGEPQLLAGFLDFVLSRDDLVRALCDAEGLDAAALHEARRALPGGAPD